MRRHPSDKCRRYIPYEACAGFSEEFVSAEACCAEERHLRVHSGRDAEARPAGRLCNDEKGSFRCDDTFRFVESLTEAERADTGNCLKVGSPPSRWFRFAIGGKSSEPFTWPTSTKTKSR